MLNNSLDTVCRCSTLQMVTNIWHTICVILTSLWTSIHVHLFYSCYPNLLNFLARVVLSKRVLCDTIREEARYWLLSSFQRSIYDKSQDRTETGRKQLKQWASRGYTVHKCFRIDSRSHPSAGMEPVTGLWVVGDNVVEVAVGGL